VRDCINILWRNGFGNQLFQYSFARLLAEENNCELTYSGFGRVCFASLIDYGFINEPEQIVKYSPDKHYIVKTIDYDGDIVFDYIENYLTYKNHLDKIRSWFPKVDKTNTDDLVVHVRRGDNGSNINTLFDWYKNVINSQKIQFDKMFLVTDTPDDSCILKFKEYYNAEVYSKKDVNFKIWPSSTEEKIERYKYDISDFNFIRSFDKILFSNSTFSWWASVLSEASEIYLNKHWQPEHKGGRIKLGLTDYPNWRGI